MEYKDLTKRQIQIFEFIQTYVKEHKISPSMRDICKGVGLSSPSTVHMHLKVLEDKGYIQKEDAKSRSLVVSKGGSNKTDNYNKISNIISLPLLGNIAAGTPILAEQNVEEEVPLPASLINNSSSFMLHVHGNSMINKGIYDGDTIIVKEQNTANNGDVVVALIDNDATVKTFYKEDNYIRLQPENDSMEPIFVREVQILGIVVGLLRSFN